MSLDLADKYGLHLEKQKWGLPATASLYAERTTGNVFYEVERNAPYEFFINVPQLKTR